MCGGGGIHDSLAMLAPCITHVLRTWRHEQFRFAQQFSAHIHTPYTKKLAVGEFFRVRRWWDSNPRSREAHAFQACAIGHYATPPELFYISKRTPVLYTSLS